MYEIHIMAYKNRLKSKLKFVSWIKKVAKRERQTVCLIPRTLFNGILYPRCSTILCENNKAYKSNTREW